MVFLTNRLEFRRLRSLIRRIWWAMINWILGDALAEIFSIDPRYHFPVEIVLLSGTTRDRHSLKNRKQASPRLR